MLQTLQAHETRPLTSSQQQSLQIPQGQTIQDIYLFFRTAAGAAATEVDIRGEIARIRLAFGGTDIVNSTAVKILDLQEMLGVNMAANTGVNGVVSLNLAQVIFADPLLRDAYGWGTADQPSIQVQVTAGTLTNIASVQAYTARTPRNEPLGRHIRFIENVKSFNSTGVDTYDTLPRDRDAAYLALLISDGASGTIASASVKVNSQTLVDNIPLNVNAQHIAKKKCVQTAGYYIHVFSDNNLNGLLPMKGVTDFRLDTNFAVAPGAAGYTIDALAVYGIPEAA